ncbi:peptidoglycan hydrolase-like protein with peptidoglycan-binding domain [Rhizobium sp. PP-F2F-G48]|uniref:peptidoglycan-binding domain-containing protein n=1 Tax=Rhizobium sp. PP-F2F-G48 TaxID=2135651 RepID=UPI00104A5919|nr:peptidoglycan-binding protein [Rhizobium sp. PP-F2F-G48]TCM55690.1 peptidoglycan hydrolase-like protein with peptidoglycan-binding domain [Rhizobium sp. PP-F2F-G48]
MAKPTRKQPDRRKTPTTKARTGAKGATALKRKGSSRPNIVLRAASGLLGLALRNPAIFGGGAAFAVVFGFVAANALWYQPSHHPSPLLRTRLPFTHPDPARVSLSDPQDVPDPSKVTTFVIRREGEGGAGDPQTAAAEPGQMPSETAPTGERTASVPAHDTLATLPGEPEAQSQPETDLDPAGLVRAVQAELARHGFYDGEADGRLGPKTTAAIRRFEQAKGRPQTGVVSASLLAALRGSGSAGSDIATITPAQRPTAIPPAQKSADGGTVEIDPIAAAIRAAEGGAEVKPKPAPVKAPVKATETASAEPAPVRTAPTAGQGSGMVMAIQRGLANLAYTDVSIDGVVGDQTRLAIRHFEKHYRLPETGEPSQALLLKMKEIGAI